MGELETMQQNDKEVGRQAISNRTKKKIKATVYLTEEAEEAFTELYIHRLRKDRKIDRSMIACDAIQALYEKECTGPISKQNIM
jgi:hypothetical protein